MKAGHGGQLFHLADGRGFRAALELADVGPSADRHEFLLRQVARKPSESDAFAGDRTNSFHSDDEAAFPHVAANSTTRYSVSSLVTKLSRARYSVSPRTLPYCFAAVGNRSNNLLGGSGKIGSQPVIEMA